MKDRFTHENGQVFRLCPLTKEETGVARSLCDACVGQNLYPEEEILRAIEEKDRFFYLLKTDKGEPAGYIYYRLTDEASIASSAKIDRAVLRAVYRENGKKVGRIQSIGLKEPYRGMGLAAQMIGFALGALAAMSAEAVFIVCWKPGGMVPLSKALKQCGFDDLTEAKKVWYDDADLICPYCKGRCRCDAEVFYKLLNGETYDENKTLA